MKHLLTFVFSIALSFYAFGQTIVLERVAELVPQGYTIEGNAFLEEFSDGSLQLRLSDDFSTPAGPDVRILLGNSLSLNGAEEIVNLSDIGHFSGELIVDVPAGIGIDDFDFILFYCVLFQQFWASGEYGDAMVPGGGGGGPTCDESTVSNVNGPNTIDICPTDNISNIISFENSFDISAGDNYAYLITDQNEILLDLILEDSYDFEGSSLSTQRVYGLHYSGTLNIAIGSNRFVTTASGCFEHSSTSNNSFITITKNACFNCEFTAVENANGSNVIDICPTDGMSDQVQFENSSNAAAGENYAYLITDENEILQEVIFDDQYNFEGSNLETQRVYGVHYDGTLNANIGSDRFFTTATICHEHSSSTSFITVLKDACISCDESDVFTQNGISTINICPSDDLNDIVSFDNSLGLGAGSEYAYLLTDENEVLQEVILADQYNFEGSTEEEQRIYGIHYIGILNSAIGQDRMLTTASECFAHSSNSDFIKITKDACAVFECMESSVSNSAFENLIDICPTDGEDDLIQFENSIAVPAGQNYAFIITDENEIVSAVIQDSEYNFEGTSTDEQRVYGIHFNGVLNPVLGANRMQTTASDCYTHSSSTDFLTITKEACPEDPFECMESATSTTDWNTLVDVCPNDGVDDIIELKNNLFLAPGEHYAYLITNANEVVQAVSTDSLFNFEGSTSTEQRVYGIHFEGSLVAMIGQDRMQTTASGCFTHSSSDIFLRVTKEACEEPFECMGSLTATTDWATSVDICPSDGVDDIIELRNNLFIAPGEHYAYLITDAEGILQEVTTDSLYNFEGSIPLEQRVYGIHYNGTLLPMIGEDRLLTESTDCFTHSGDNLFLTITKNGCAEPYECQESLTASTNWVTDIDICATDGASDVIELQNNIFEPIGTHYAFLLTDEFENLQEVVFDTVYDFENTGVEEQRIYGISFDGQLEPKIGENRKNTTATNCFIHSGDNLFITINKTATCATSTEEEDRLQDEIKVFPNPTDGRLSLDYDSATIDIIDIKLINIQGQTVGFERVGNELLIDEAGIYLLHILTEGATISKKVIVQGI